MTLLVCDLGNHRWKWALATNGLDAPGRPVNYQPDFDELLDQEFSDVERPERAVAVSVTTDARAESLRKWLKSRWNLILEVFRPGAHMLGVTNQYENPEQLGADRWAALIGARHRTRDGVSIVDAGTAVTIDALDSEGVFRGGVIMPGLVMQRESLRSGTAAGLSTTGLAGDVLGHSTTDAIAGGTLNGLAGAIDRIVKLQSDRTHSSPRIFLTGGDALILRAHLLSPTDVVPDLVLEGVVLMARSP